MPNFDCFIEFLDELHTAAGLQNDYSCAIVNNLANQINQEFKRRIKAVLLDKKTYYMTPDIDINTVNDSEIRDIIFEQETAEYAMKFRANILKINSKPLPEYLDSAALEKGECETPKWLNLFWTTVLSGVKKKITDRVSRLASTFSQDAIYNVTKGCIKPSKHILLGIAMKSMTGSEKIINILSKLGYCVSYSTLVELETSVAYSCTASQNLCPSSIYATNFLPSGVAWDNFDRFTETSGKGTIGKDTLHDTVGIIYQSIPTRAQLTLINSTPAVGNSSNNTLPSLRNLKTGRRKRSFAFEDDEVLPPAKQSRPNFWTSSIAYNPDLQQLSTFNKINFGWLLSKNFKLPNTPMWVGYVSKMRTDKSPIQKVEYLLQINDSPTNPDVVKETMVRSLQLAAECGKEYYNVTIRLSYGQNCYKGSKCGDGGI